jgi:DNA (cytosine-5)-methyltransferase 1
VLAHHHPDVPNLGDVTKITEADIQALGHIDLVVFGSPCQDLSIAGQRKGLINEHGDITRSGLFFTAVNIFHWSRARFALWENVPGAFSSGQGCDFASVVSFMAGLDDVDVPPNGWGTEGAALGDNGLLEWSTLDAQWFGVAQRRRRVFAILDAGDWAGRPPILLEPESLRGDTAPRRESGEVAARGTETGTYECGGIGRYSSSSPLMQSGANLSPGCEALITQPFVVANTLTQRMGKGINSTVDEGQTPVVTHSLRGEGFSRGGGTQGQGPVIAYCIQGSQIGRHDLAGPSGSGFLEEVGFTQTGADQHAVAFNWNAQAAQLPSTGGRDYSVNDGLTCSQQGAVAFQASQSGITLDSNIGMQVRRLTPRECERLQGFPDDHTLIPYRNKPVADGPRYKALGNSMAVPVMRHIGIKVMEAVWTV